MIVVLPLIAPRKCPLMKFWQVPLASYPNADRMLAMEGTLSLLRALYNGGNAESYYGQSCQVGRIIHVRYTPVFAVAHVAFLMSSWRWSGRLVPFAYLSNRRLFRTATWTHHTGLTNHLQGVYMLIEDVGLDGQRYANASRVGISMSGSILLVTLTS